MGILSALGFTENNTEKRARQQAEAAQAAEQNRAGALDQQAATSRSRYQGALDAYDPQAFMKQAAESQISDLGEQYGQAEGQRRIAANRSGFINSGGGIGAQTRDFNTRLARALSGLSLQTAQLQQNKVGMQGDLYSGDVNQATGARDNYLDITSANRDAATASRNSRLNGTLGIVKAGASAAAYL